MIYSTNTYSTRCTYLNTIKRTRSHNTNNTIAYRHITLNYCAPYVHYINLILAERRLTIHTLYLLTLHEVHTVTITPLPIPQVPTANIHTIITVHIFTILIVPAAITEYQQYLLYNYNTDST